MASSDSRFDQDRPATAVQTEPVSSDDTAVPRRPGSILGTRVQRTEDPSLLVGTATYLADLDLSEYHPDGALHAVFVRSDVAHGRLIAVHTDDAATIDGVVAIWTAADLGVDAHHGFVKVHDDFARPPLATDTVRFVGEPIAVVLARTATAGRDAAEAVWADIEPLPAVVDAEDALASDAPVIFNAHGDNLALQIIDPGPLDLEAISDHVVRGRYVNQRVAVAPMETDGCAAAVGDDGRLIVWPSTQMPHVVRDQLAAALDMSTDELHIITPQVGGGFGGKVGLHHEFSVVAAAARRLGRPVIWSPTRREDMVSLPHGRGQVQYVELGCRNDGTFTGLRVRLVGDAGAYPTIGAFLCGGTRRMSNATYDVGAIDFDVAVAVTNTTPVGAYRGAGRPEATALIERVVDQAAMELGIDPIELRLANFIGDDAFPYQTIPGNVYDSGRYAMALRRAAELADYEGRRAEQARRRDSGDRRWLGIGVAAYVEITAGGASEEYARVEVNPDGTATVFAGTAAHGQGHATSFAMLVSDQTGIPVESITLVDGDTDRVPRGGGTGGSRSLQLGGSAVHHATEVLVDTARQLAAEILEADPADIEIDPDTGTIAVAGVPASAMTWAELATRTPDATALQGEFIFDQHGATFPFGAHIAVVEVDSDTGHVTLVQHVAVDDCGTVLNPTLVEGQQHGGLAAGIAQALYEEVRFDADGNPVTSNFAEYGIASAAEFPSFDVHSTETPSPLNPLGAKGIGEAATIGSTPAVQNAVIDALAHLGIRHLDLPCTPERVWRAIHAARAGTPPDPWREPPEIFATFDKPSLGAEADTDDETEAGVAAAEGV